MVGVVIIRRARLDPYFQARASVLYDVKNNIVIDSILSKVKVNERELAKEHFKHIRQDDLIIFDRGYSSYELFATIVYSYNANFLMRIRSNFYKDIKFLFNKKSKIKDITVILKPSTKDVVNICHSNNLPIEIEVRFVQVILDNGEIEVVATSILDNGEIATKEFKELYYQRWGVETFYNIIKNRLSLENFTGLSALSIKQDFFVTIFITNYETILTYNINNELDESTKNNKYPQKINKSVSFNTVKNYCLELFYSNCNTSKIINEMRKFLLMNPVCIRENRTSIRRDKKRDKTTLVTRSLNYNRRGKKSVF